MSTDEEIHNYFKILNLGNTYIISPHDLKAMLRKHVSSIVDRCNEKGLNIDVKRGRLERDCSLCDHNTNNNFELLADLISDEEGRLMDAQGASTLTIQEPECTYSNGNLFEIMKQRTDSKYKKIKPCAYYTSIFEVLIGEGELVKYKVEK